MDIETTIEQNSKTTDKLKEPSKYKVIVCNDDVTPVEFVVTVMMSVFRHTEANALEITLKIHNSGSAIAGIYSYEVAEQKGIDATNLARSNGYPLIIKVEPE